ncbi:hypothetical protein IV38_GL001994 [Lactobacillus selangorensis]|uniref:Glycoside hydrolase family 42 N-terminal domain-containing protein n=1 Tax=Lactobacillus selangorensis TaxID=81857 RepID=A0A0R2FG22_9LACO|nr:hypothetical protein [Lactobacillus selangorensis]KRN27539.1 hypothetical protein IV38_GL001994 [Lactobacillus selangorensis]KRN30189.1 hypothetical protein IV40_GL002035 [Lactobacillus selangorensis]
MTYHYALRFTLDPQHYTKTQIEQLVTFCQQAQIDEVVFFINSEELNQSFLTPAQTQQWLDAIQKFAQPLRDKQIEIGLNPWTTLNHGDRGRHVAPEIGFHTLVNYQGVVTESIACPGDPKWQEYLSDSYAQYATIQPHTLWLEDDFRHYKSAPVTLGCFCEAHMREYAKVLGHPITRSEFVRKLLQPGAVTPERQAYLEVARQEMKHVAHLIEEKVHRVSPNTLLGLMTSYPDWHCVEARDWHGLFAALSGNQATELARPHLPAYNEISPLKYSRAFEKYTRTTAAFLGNQVTLYPELENYMYSPYVKSRRFTQFQIETAGMAGATGIMLNLFDMMGNGVDENDQYADMLAESKPLLNAMAATRIDIDHLAGIKVPMSQDAAYHVHTTAGREIAELVPHETKWLELLGTFGFAVTPVVMTANTQFHDEVVAISGQFLRDLSAEQIRQLFQDNLLLLDGESAAVLLERGLGDLIHAESGEWHPVRTGYQSFEQTVAAPQTRITMLSHTGDYFQIAYQPSDEVDVLSMACSADGQELGPMLTAIDHQYLLLPLNDSAKYGWEAQYNDYRSLQLKQILADDAAYLVDMPACKLVVSNNQMLVANFSLDAAPQIKWHDNGQLPHVKEVTVQTRKGAQTMAVRQEGQTYQIDYSLAALETVLIEFRKEGD